MNKSIKFNSGVESGYGSCLDVISYYTKSRGLTASVTHDMYRAYDGLSSLMYRDDAKKEAAALCCAVLNAMLFDKAQVVIHDVDGRLRLVDACDVGTVTEIGAALKINK